MTLNHVRRALQELCSDPYFVWYAALLGGFAVGALFAYSEVKQVNKQEQEQNRKQVSETCTAVMETADLLSTDVRRAIKKAEYKAPLLPALKIETVEDAKEAVKLIQNAIDEELKKQQQNKTHVLPVVDMSTLSQDEQGKAIAELLTQLFPKKCKEEAVTDGKD